MLFFKASYKKHTDEELMVCVSKGEKRAFDELYERSIQITDNLERRAVYQKMDSLVMESAAVIPLYYDEVVRFTQKNVSGLGINPINHLDLKRVKKD